MEYMFPVRKPRFYREIGPELITESKSDLVWNLAGEVGDRKINIRSANLGLIDKQAKYGVA